jgi:hypothetical protein
VVTHATEQNNAVPCRRFILRALDDTTECPTVEVIFDVDEVVELCGIIGGNAADIDSGAEYELELSEVDQLKARFKVSFEPGSLAVRLRRWGPLDDLPYKIHTGRELALMLKGSKPLAYFSAQYPPNPDVEEIPQRLFDPHVEAGRFVKREYVIPATNRSSGTRHGTWVVIYALPHQEWRINAFILLLDAASKSGWSEGFERMQGSLLGYEDWQNDIFIERIYRPACEKQKK